MRKDSLDRLAQHGVATIPAAWKQSRVKYLGSYMNGYPFKPSDWSAEGRPILRIQDLSGSNADPNRFAGEIDRRYLVRPGDLLISWSASLGVYRWAGEEAWLNQHIFKVGLDESRVCESFFVWLAAWFIGEMDREAHGSTMQHLTADAFGGFPVLLPPQPQQAAIAGFLDRETAQIDALIAAKGRVLDLLAEKRKAIIATAVTRGLEPRVKLRDPGVPWLGDIPAHWRSTRVGRLFRQSKMLGYPDLTVLSVYREFGVIERASREDNANRVPDDLSKYQLVEVGDLVINKMKAWQGSLGVSDLRGITSPDYVVFRPVHSEDPAFLHSMLRMPQLTTVYLSISNGIRINQWRIEPERFANVEVFLPPIDEQRAIVAHIARETAKLDAVRAATESTIALLKERRSALIAAAVTGQLDVGAAA